MGLSQLSRGSSIKRSSFILALGIVVLLAASIGFGAGGGGNGKGGGILGAGQGRVSGGVEGHLQNDPVINCAPMDDQSAAGDGNDLDGGFLVQTDGYSCVLIADLNMKLKSAKTNAAISGKEKKKFEELKECILEKQRKNNANKPYFDEKGFYFKETGAAQALIDCNKKITTGAGGGGSGGTGGGGEPGPGPEGQPEPKFVWITDPWALVDGPCKKIIEALKSGGGAFVTVDFNGGSENAENGGYGHSYTVTTAEVVDGGDSTTELDDFCRMTTLDPFKPSKTTYIEAKASGEAIVTMKDGSELLTDEGEMKTIYTMTF